ncbi:MAG: T9SS type A sorting domain-containing protein [Bacteroidetes bacterium]|nr:T9SS type A sorting domain-containing protein [Bacteroidota bacterium]
MKYLTLTLMMFASLSLSAQYGPEEMDHITNPAPSPLQYPTYGFKALISYGDSMLGQFYINGNWEDSSRYYFIKNKRGRLAHLQFSEMDSGAWTDALNIQYSHKYNSNGTLAQQRSTMFNAVMEIIHNYQFSYNSNGDMTSATGTDSMYYAPMSMWLVTPGRETYTYNSSNQLTERLIEMASFANPSTYLNENRYVFTYDGNGNCTRVQEYDWDDDLSSWIEDNRYDFTYDSNDRMATFKETYYDGITWVQYGDEENFAYDSNGRLSRSEEISPDDTSEATDYSYNANGTAAELINYEKPFGTSTWIKTGKTVFYYKNGASDYALVYKWTGSQWETNPVERVLFQGWPASGSVPTAPSNLQVFLNKRATAHLRLTWDDNSNDEDGFILYRSEDDSNYTIIDTLAPNTIEHIDSALVGNTTYYYKLTAYNASGASGFSNTVSETTKPVGLAQANRQRIGAYPNPTKGLISLAGYGQQPEYKVIDMRGQELMHGRGTLIDLSSAAPGWYVVQINTPGITTKLPVYRN